MLANDARAQYSIFESVVLWDYIQDQSQRTPFAKIILVQIVFSTVRLRN